MFRWFLILISLYDLIFKISRSIYKMKNRVTAIRSAPPWLPRNFSVTIPSMWIDKRGPPVERARISGRNWFFYCHIPFRVFQERSSFLHSCRIVYHILLLEYSISIVSPHRNISLLIPTKKKKKNLDEPASFLYEKELKVIFWSLKEPLNIKKKYKFLSN